MRIFLKFRLYAAALLCSSLSMPVHSFANQENYDYAQTCEPECCEAPCGPSGKRTALVAGAGILAAAAIGAVAGVAASNDGHRGSRGERGARGERGSAGTPGTSCGSVVDTGETLTFNLSFDVSGEVGETLFSSDPIAFIETPCGQLLTAEFTEDFELFYSTSISIPDPEFGIYHIGFQIHPYNLLTFNLLSSVMSDSRGPTDVLFPNTQLGPVETQIVRPFEYGPASSEIPSVLPPE